LIQSRKAREGDIIELFCPIEGPPELGACAVVALEVAGIAGSAALKFYGERCACGGLDTEGDSTIIARDGETAEVGVEVCACLGCEGDTVGGAGDND